MLGVVTNGIRGTGRRQLENMANGEETAAEGSALGIPTNCSAEECEEPCLTALLRVARLL
jgi:hypothetical protein